MVKALMAAGPKRLDIRIPKLTKANVEHAVSDGRRINLSELKFDPNVSVYYKSALKLGDCCRRILF